MNATVRIKRWSLAGLAALLLPLMAASAASAQVAGFNGYIQSGTCAAPTNAVHVNLESGGTYAVEPYLAKGANQALGYAGAPQAPETPTLPDGPPSAKLRAERQKNCEIARETQERYTLSRRLFRTNAVGEREYLDDAAVAEARAKAAADVKDWCG